MSDDDYIINYVPRPMVGLFAQLTEEQKQSALSYCGPEDHGEPQDEPAPLRLFLQTALDFMGQIPRDEPQR